MRARTTVTLLACWAAIGFSPIAHAHSPGKRALAALQFFERLPERDVAAVLHALRPSHISAAERARAVAVLPESGELQPEPG